MTIGARAERRAAPEPAACWPGSSTGQATSALAPSGDRPPYPAAEGPALQALIWDVDGTLAETERDGHRVAFNGAFAAAGLPWRWSVARYGELLATTGGFERLLRDMAERADAPRTAAEREALARELHRRKNAAYAALVARGEIALRPGVRRLMHEARAAGARLAIATTTGRATWMRCCRASSGRAGPTASQQSSAPKTRR